jgi:ribosomal protein S10
MLTLNIKSYNVENVSLFINRVKEMIRSLKHAKIRRLSRLPKMKKRITLLKSPHVNSQAKEQFMFTIHS